MDAVSSSLKLGKTAVDKKRELDKSRREVIHTRMRELYEVVEPFRDRQVRTKKWDKELVLADAIQVITSFSEKIQTLETQLNDTLAENAQLKDEKNELRNDKQYLKSEIDKLREETRGLRSDNIALWQFMKEQGLISANPQPVEASNNTSSITKEVKPVKSKVPRTTTVFADEPANKRFKEEIAQGQVPAQFEVETPSMVESTAVNMMPSSATPDLNQFLPGAPSPALDSLFDFFQSKHADLVGLRPDSPLMLGDEVILDSFELDRHSGIHNFAA
eukprot:CAMPEP_0184692618 /NCGR_PEP_ID=MMETSP0313-20130426/1021_1 /TAXON_ID=2792 /ORGANISM="Porphyridium aerugineum, Strain SAG 1380-2" /LENGTH=274 /DNA_ID=CAMNT_0027150459 /DNA_START=131 /DNA_END=955 /DNA_ORIENTATION=+